MKSKRQSLTLGLALSVLLLLSFSSVTPAFGQSQLISVASLLRPDGTLNAAAGVNGTLDLRGWNVTLDSKRGPVLAPEQEADVPSSVPVDQWWALPHRGLNNTVYALAVMGIGPFYKVYVGGEHFHTTDGADMGNVAVFDTYSGVWSSLPGGGLDYFQCSNPQCDPVIVKSGAVYAFAVSGTDLFVGGNFQFTSDGQVGDLNYIAKFNTSNDTWAALPNHGLGAPVNALAMVGSTLYVGGEFFATFFGDVTNLNYIAKFSSNTWSPVYHNGLNNTVWALAASGSDLYIGGDFSADAAGVVTNLSHIAKLSGGVWNSLSDGGLNDTVYALALNGTSLYVGGLFIRTTGSAVTNLNRIANYDTSGDAWSVLPHNGLNGAVLALTVDASTNTVYAGGGFTHTADNGVSNLNHVAKLRLVLFQGLVWSPLPNHGLNGAVNALEMVGDDLYVGGVFTQTADTSVGNLNRIARLVPTSKLFLPLVNK